MDSNTARAIKSKGSKIEQLLAKSMWNKGMRYQKNVSAIFGKPDFIFKSKKIAIFCDSEFWHGYNYIIKGERFKTNPEFWEKKILRNIERDKEVTAKLSEEGWIVLRFWGKQIQKELESCINTIEEAYQRKKSK